MLAPLPKDIELVSVGAPFEASSLAPEHSKQREPQMQRPRDGSKLVVFLEQRSSQCGWNGGPRSVVPGRAEWDAAWQREWQEGAELGF